MIYFSTCNLLCNPLNRHSLDSFHFFARVSNRYWETTGCLMRTIHCSLPLNLCKVPIALSIWGHSMEGLTELPKLFLNSVIRVNFQRFLVLKITIRLYLLYTIFTITFIRLQIILTCGLVQKMVSHGILVISAYSLKSSSLICSCAEFICYKVNLIWVRVLVKVCT